MRFVIAGLILSVALPAAEAGSRNAGQCKARCDSNYQFCQNRSTTKQARKSCRADRKICKKTCGK
jgi:hypothetical protein